MTIITMTSMFAVHFLQVIHDCRAIAGCLIAQFGVKLTNVFDTQVHAQCVHSLAFMFLSCMFELTYFLLFFLHVWQVADVMCFYSETAGFLPDRVSTLQEVVSLHLKVPSSQLLSLQMKSQLTKVQRAVSSEVVLLTMCLCLCVL